MAASALPESRGRGKTTPAGDALHELLYEISFTYFRLQAAASGRGAGELTAGQVSMLRSLAREGPQTVPAIARARPVARQPVQRMADELAARGLVAFEPNPQHRRSRLVALTPAGRKLYARIERAQRAAASRIAGEDLSEGRLKAAARLVRTIGERVLEEVGEPRA
ncbi:MAG: MarR family transcriptional regulator [Proteobacteria bacterium]|nr:MarR family transcriptional regulator [Pseudomonadota bacterium]